MTQAGASDLLSTPAVAVPWLRAAGLTKSFGGVHALHGVDLELLTGEVHGVIGPNGAGKSTLVKILAGAQQADTGTMQVDGQSVHFANPLTAQRHRVVMMPQEIALVPDSTLTDNIVLGAEPTIRGLVNVREARARAVRAMQAIDLELDPGMRAQDLSTVHRRLLMLARAIDRKTRLLILDEPTAGLAAHEAEIVAATVANLNSHGVTVVYISHYLSEVAALCDRVTCIREGLVAATLSKDEITHDSLVRLILGGASTSAELPPRAIQIARDESRPVGEVGVTIEGRGIIGSRLRDVSFVARPGEVTGITGLLGSGVTELIGIVVGSVAPLSGSLEFNRVPQHFKSPADALRAGVGYLAGDRTSVAFSDMSVRENVTISALDKWFGKLGIVRRTAECSKASDILERLGVKVPEEGLISNLSGGNQQRALVGRLVAADVPCIVLDEPTVGVDVHARRTLWATIRSLADSCTVIVASSEPEELVAMCDRVLCIRDGRIAHELEGSSMTAEAITHAIT